MGMPSLSMKLKMRQTQIALPQLQASDNYSFPKFVDDFLPLTLVANQQGYQFNEPCLTQAPSEDLGEVQRSRLVSQWARTFADA